MKTAYPAIVHDDPDGVWVEFPDLPGCYSDGDTVASAVDHAGEALGMYLCALLDQGEPLPEASDPRLLHPESGFSTLVVADPLRYKKKTRAVKKTLTVPEWMNEEAERAGINFSQVLQEGLAARLGL